MYPFQRNMIGEEKFVDTNFSLLLRPYRKNMGWTQEELSQKWSYSFETVSAWERRKRIPSKQEIFV
jgi:transcriptional regulator with XRE-family HTH domain